MQDALAFLATLAADLTDSGDRISAEKLVTATGVGGLDGVTALLELARLIGEASDPGTLPAALDLAPPIDPFTTIARHVAACFAAVRADYPSRQDAQAARADISRRGEDAYAAASIAGADALGWLVGMTGDTVAFLSSEAGNRAPAVRVETGMSLPSTLIAYDLYGDAGRAGELVDRNRSATSLIMPAILEAVAS